MRRMRFTTQGNSNLFLFTKQILIWQHALMKEAEDNAVILGPIEHDMTSMLHAHQSGTDGVAIPKDEAGVSAGGFLFLV
jgi:hypothetical protein